MSIYATTFSIDADDHAEDCKRVRNVGGILQVSDKRPCTCKAGPLAYQRSHVLPSDDDPRSGSFDLAAIPGFIEREGRPPLSEDEDWPYWPWLRVSINSEIVVLTRDQVVKLREAIDFWLDNTTTSDAIAELSELRAERDDALAEAKGARSDYEQLRGFNTELAAERDRLRRELDKVRRANILARP